MSIILAEVWCIMAVRLLYEVTTGYEIDDDYNYVYPDYSKYYENTYGC